jgi:hypothetical protein
MLFLGTFLVVAAVSFFISIQWGNLRDEGDCSKIGKRAKVGAGGKYEDQSPPAPSQARNG